MSVDLTRVIGGPVHLLHDKPGCFCGFHGLQMEPASYDGQALTLVAIVSGGMPALPTQESLVGYFRSVGATFEKHLGGSFDDWLTARISFRWVMHEGVFVPTHWMPLGVEKCAAYCRIFGPNETEWPKEHWDAISNACRDQVIRLSGRPADAA